MLLHAFLQHQSAFYHIKTKHYVCGVGGLKEVLKREFFLLSSKITSPFFWNRTKKKIGLLKNLIILKGGADFLLCHTSFISLKNLILKKMWYRRYIYIFQYYRSVQLVARPIVFYKIINHFNLNQYFISIYL